MSLKNMNRDDIIRMAKEAGFERTKMHKALERFATIVAAEEREWCAEFLLSTDLNELKFNHELQNFIATLLLSYATAIRARGQHD